MEKREIVYYIVLVAAVLYCLLILVNGVMLLTPKPHDGAVRSLNNFCGFIFVMVGLALGFAAYSLKNQEFQTPFIIFLASSVILLLFGGGLPFVISLALAGGVRYVVGMD